MADFLNSEKALNDFTNNLRKCLNEKNLAAALNLINENKGKQEIQSSLSEIIPIVVAHINEDIQREKPKLFSCSEKIINAIAENFEVEGVLLQLIEDIEQACDDTAFLTLLQPLEKILLRLPKRRLNSLEWGLNAIRLYLNQLLLPENLNLEESEEILMDADPLVERISILYVSLLPLYDTLIKDLYTEETKVNDRKIILLKFLLQLLGKPLAFLDLKCGEKTKSRGRRVAESIIEKILNMISDIFWILDLQTTNSLFNIRQVDDLSMATFFYLIVAENVLLEKVPKVYDHVYIFQHTLHLVTELFKHDNQFVVHNGLQLSQTLLNNVSGIILSYHLLDSEHHSKFCAALSNVIIYNELEKHRKRALGIFRQYLLNFEMHGRYLLIYNLMKVLNHTGMIAYLITLYKDMIMEEFNNDCVSIYVTGPKLFVLLDMFCYLHKGEESDMVELADQIVASLNLLRYLAIRDKTNISKVWEHFKNLEKSYFEPLKKGLTLSRAHYELKIKELKTESGEGDKSDSKVSVTVAGQKLNEIPTNEKLKVLYSALTSFDVIESLLSRVTELIIAKVHNVN